MVPWVGGKLAREDYMVFHAKLTEILTPKATPEAKAAAQTVFGMRLLLPTHYTRFAPCPLTAQSSCIRLWSCFVPPTARLGH